MNKINIIFVKSANIKTERCQMWGIKKKFCASVFV